MSRFKVYGSMRQLSRKALIGFLLSPALLLAQQAETTVSDLVKESQSERERVLSTMIEKSLSSESLTGAFQSYQGSLIDNLSPGQIALRVLQHNLQLTLAESDKELAETALQEAEAVFDPVLNVNVGYTREESYERTITGTVQRTVFNPLYEDPNTGLPAGPGEIILPEGVQQDTGIEKVIFSNLQADTERATDVEVFVSKEDPNGAQDAYSMSAVLQQLTPWGVTYDLTLGTVNKKTYYDNQGHSFDAPWASELLLNVEVPINDLGADASAGLGNKISQLEAQRQAAVLKSRINELLLASTRSYLDLIAAAERMQISQDLLALTEEQFDATKARFDQRTATSYELAQIEAQLAFAKSEKELADAAYLQASNTLLALSSENAEKITGRVIVPISYSRWLQTGLEIDLEQAMQTALDSHPNLNDQMLQVAQAEARYRTAVLQTRPDLRLKVGVDMRQNNSVHGYDDLVDSLSSVFDPDIASQRIGAEYLYPVGNHQRKAARTIAEAGLSDSQYGHALEKRTIEQDMLIAFSELTTANAILDERNNRLEIAQKSYNSVARLARSGSATQNELINALRELQNARVEKVNGELDIKRAELELLAAQGALEENFANWTARNTLELQRLAMLETQAGFGFFARSASDQRVRVK